MKTQTIIPPTQGVLAAALSKVLAETQMPKVAPIDEHVAYMECMSSKASAPINTKEMSVDYFHDFEIGNMHFQAFVAAKGPCLTSVPPSDRLMGGIVEIGAAQIRFCTKPTWDGMNARIRGSTGEGWQICHDLPVAPQIDINTLTEEERFTLAHEFGIPVYAQPESEVDQDTSAYLPRGERLFFLSPAFPMFCSWARKFPNIINIINSTTVYESYLPGWKDALITGEYHPNWHGWKGGAIKG